METINLLWLIKNQERINCITADYYEKKDLADFADIGEYSPTHGRKYFDYYGEATNAGALSAREKALIAPAVATTKKCPYCIDAYTNQCLNFPKLATRRIVTGNHCYGCRAGAGSSCTGTPAKSDN
ncbi:MAG: DUF3641 domain-containing protein [Smithella sp.]